MVEEGLVSGGTCDAPPIEVTIALPRWKLACCIHY